MSMLTSRPVVQGKRVVETVTIELPAVVDLLVQMLPVVGGMTSIQLPVAAEERRKRRPVGQQVRVTLADRLKLVDLSVDRVG